MPWEILSFLAVKMSTGTAEAGGRCQGAGDPGDFSTPGGAAEIDADVMGWISWDFYEFTHDFYGDEKW